MASIDLFTTWTQLSEAQQLTEWRTFMVSLDAGDAGHHRYYLVLMPLWDRGDVPAVVEAEAMDAYETEMREQAEWEARNSPAADAWMDRCILADDPSEALFWDRFDPEGADRLLGCPPF